MDGSATRGAYHSGLTGVPRSHRFEGMTSGRLGLALVVAMTAGRVAHADLASGRDKLIAGDYKAAISELGKVTGKDRPAVRSAHASTLTALTPVATRIASPDGTCMPSNLCDPAPTVKPHLHKGAMLRGWPKLRT